VTTLSTRRVLATRHSRARGQTLVEFALVIPILIVMLMGIFDLGRAIFAYNAITNAAREGARLGIVNQWADKIKERAIDMAPTADQDPNAVTVAISKPASPPDDDDCASAPAVGCVVYVRYESEFTAITPIIGSIVGPMTLTAESVEPIEYVCGVAGAAITNPDLCPRQP
jgi:Flp pilus assembly protein TadG